MTRLARLVLAGLAIAAPLGAQSGFPAAWAGRWRGTLTTVSPPDSVRQVIPLTLEIAPIAGTRAFTWRTIFNADTVRGLRDYKLLLVDPARGVYATDEGNGVLLEESYVGGLLVSVFQVGPRVLESRMELRGDTLVHDITWWSATPARRVTGQGANAEGGTEITSHRVEGRQRAVLTRAP